MKNLKSTLFCILSIPIIFFSNTVSAQEVVQVGAGEYLTVYRMSNRTVKVSNQSSVIPILSTYAGLDSIVDVQGGQYHILALDQQGKVYKLGKYATYTMVTVDEFGEPFNDNFLIRGFWQSNVSLRGSDSSLWYWGIADPMNYNGGADIIAPIKLNMPAGKKFKKLETGASSSFSIAFILAHATDNTVWRYDRNNPNPVQISISGETIIDIAALGCNAQVLLTASNKLYAAGFYSRYAGTSTNTNTFTNVTSAWTNAGMQFPVKELVGNSNTLHIIDANDNMFGSGSNVQGEVGTGIEYSPYRIPGPQGGVFGYGFNNGLLLTPPTQIHGKFKNVNTSTTITFYLYAQDLGNNWYSWGRNKAFSLGNGRSLGPYAGWGGAGDYAAYANAIDVPMPKKVNLTSLTWTLQSFNPNDSLPPVVGAGINQYIAVPSTTLYGKAFQQEHSIASHLWTKVSGPAGGTIVSPTSPTTEVNGMATAGTYVFRLSATNTNGQTSSDEVSIVVSSSSSNASPTVNAGNDQTITLPLSTITLNGTATDADGVIVNQQWLKIAGPSGGAITNPTQSITAVTGLIQGTYSYQLTVTDNAGAVSRDTVQIIVLPAPNQAPVANAGNNISVSLPVTTAVLSGSGTDPDGTVTGYRWNKISGPAGGTIAVPLTAIVTVIGLVPGIYEYELTVTDNNGATGKDTVQVNVSVAPNQPPVANAGSDIVISLPVNTVNLTGTGTDPDGSVSSYLWTKVSGPSSGTIINNSSANTTVTDLSQGVYQFSLQVTDNNGATASDIIQVTVNGAPNVPPTVNAGNDIVITLPVNSTNLSGNATDADGSIVSYQWTRIAGPATGTIVSATSAATAINNLIQGVYRFRLLVTDNNGATASDDVQVTVNQAPTVNAGNDISITLPVNTATLTATGVDPDGSVASYQWSKISGPATGSIVTATTPVTVVNNLIQGVYEFSVQIADNNGAIAIDTVKVTVIPAPNQIPVANAGNDIIISLPLNIVTLSGSGTDADGTIASYQWTKVTGPTTFTITNPTSAITSVTNLVQGAYQFRLQVTDNSGAVSTDIMFVFVHAAAAPPNQPPSANAGNDIEITLPINSIELNGSGTDTDGSVIAYQWLQISGPAGPVIVNPGDMTTVVNHLSQGVYLFQLTVTDNSGSTDKDTIQVTVLPAPPNQSPVANAGNDQNITLPVNSVSLNGTGTDTDGSIVSFSWVKISGPASGTIANAALASTSVTNMVQGTYQFELTVRDNNNATGKDTIQVIVNAAPPPPNQAPVANAGNDFQITLPVNSAALNGSGTDSDGTIVSYQWAKISGPSAGSITQPNSASTSLHLLVQGVYKFELTVRDNNGAVAKDTIQLTVNAALPNNPPTANAGLDQNLTLPANTTSLTGTATDTDGTIVSYQWTKIAGPVNGGVINPTSSTCSITNLVEGIYRFEFRVADDDGAIGRDTVQVVVNAQQHNDIPVVNLGNDINIYLPENSVSIAGSVTDPDGFIVNYQWNVISGPSAYQLTGAGMNATLTNLLQGNYEVMLTVIDNNGGLARDTVLISVGSSRPFAREDDEVNVFPNPVQTMLTIDINTSKVDRKATMVILDLKGSVIARKDIMIMSNTQRETINMSKFASGNYILQIISDDTKAITRKIIKL